MAKPNIIEINGVGPVLFERSARAKYLNISVKPFRGVRVAVPRGMSFKMAEQSVNAKAGWMQKHIAKMKQLEKEHEEVSGKEVQIDRKEAEKTLVARLKELAGKHGFTFNRVFIRNQKTLWGSCSSKNNISLNVKVLLLPEDLRDFIILHELVHTKVKNHGRDFWAALLKAEPNAKAFTFRVNKYNIRLLQPVFVQ
jgi:predicted metal-dependent hydrolase